MIGFIRRRRELEQRVRDHAAILAGQYRRIEALEGAMVEQGMVTVCARCGRPAPWQSGCLDHVIERLVWTKRETPP